MTWKTPSHRDQSKPQVEFCDLCGAMVAAEDRILATAEGLAGFWVCKEHADLALNPSFNDEPGYIDPPKQNEFPHSGENWAIVEPEDGWP